MANLNFEEKYCNLQPMADNERRSPQLSPQEMGEHAAHVTGDLLNRPVSRRLIVQAFGLGLANPAGVIDVLSQQLPIGESPQSKTYELDLSDGLTTESSQGCESQIRYDDESHEYQILTDCPSQYFSWVNRSFSDFDFRVTARQIEGHNSTKYGIAAGFNISPKIQIREIFLISGTGEYSLYESVINPQKPSSRNPWRMLPVAKNSQAVNRDNSSNDFRMRRNEDRIEIILNDNVMFSATRALHHKQATVGFAVFVPPVIIAGINRVDDTLTNIGFRNLQVYGRNKQDRYPFVPGWK